MERFKIIANTLMQNKTEIISIYTYGGKDIIRYITNYYKNALLYDDSVVYEYYHSTSVVSESEMIFTNFYS